ncbi:MAG: tRNA(His) guanylyltransferase Thg1 family protein [Phycisphaerales bacterium]
MKFDELETRMRMYESARDTAALPGVYLVARIDGRGFTRLTKEVMPYERPFDATFRDNMIATVHHLMECGFRVAYGYTQSDEISLLFDRDENSFGRSTRKWTSLLAAEASAAFSVRLGQPAAFDCRIIELPTSALVVDYFRWRNEDAHRNALSAWCYWTLRGEGVDAGAATEKLKGMPASEKNELLFQRGINFNNLPMWQRRGVGVVWSEYDKEATNPQTGEKVTAKRRRLETLMELSMRDEYSAFVLGLLSSAV